MEAPEQMLWLVTDALTEGMGFTVTSNVAGVPVQPLAEGVMVKVTTTGALVVLVRVPLINPDPLAATPVTAVVLFLVQLNVVPATGPAGFTFNVAPEQTELPEIAVTDGDGFTSTVEVWLLSQPLTLAVVVKVTVCGVLVVLTNEPEMVLVVPLAAMPVTAAVLSRVQL